MSAKKPEQVNHEVGADVEIVMEEQTPSAEQTSAANPAKQYAGKGKKKAKGAQKRKRWPIVVGLLVVVVAGFLVWRGLGSEQQVASASEFTEEAATRRNITASLSGSGTLQPADSYTLTTLIEGDILSAPFEEGDVVEKDALLYEVDDSDVSNSLEKAQLSLSQSQSNYSRKLDGRTDLNVTALEAGSIVELNVEVGDKVTAGQSIGSIRNQGTMSLTVPFASDDAARLYVGQSATVVLDGSFETLFGTVSKVSGTDEVVAGGMQVRQVTIDVENPGGISSGQSATAMVGEVACNSAGTFGYKGEATITADTSGKVAKIYADEGDFVNKGQTILTLSSDTLDAEIESAANSLRDAQLSLENQTKQINDYTIRSPIAGTIVEKFYKEGDTLESGKTLCTIFDLSYLEMTLNVDELDISQVEVGQEVTITADAVAGEVYHGVVTKININGTTNNGVTSYPVTIRIDEPGSLLPGMNVDAEIVTKSAENVLTIPNGAIARGNRVLVKTATTTDGAANDGTTPPQGRPQQGDMPQGLDPENMPEGFSPENMPEDAAVSFNVADDSAAGGQQPQASPGGGADGAPEGFEYRIVETGISDDYYTEIISGLNEGDIVAVYETTGDLTMNPMMMNMGGGSVVVMENGPGGGPGGPR